MSAPIKSSEIKTGFFTALNLSPIDVGYGLLMISAIGLEHAGAGIAAALLAVGMGNLLPAISGQSGMLFSGARPAQTLLITELITRLADGIQGGNVFLAVFPYVAICTMLAGALQLAFGLLRAGGIIKYIPIPVLTGYINAVALLMLWPSLLLILGLPRGSGIEHAFSQANGGMVFSLGLGIVLILLMARAHSKWHRVHWSIAGLFGGMLIYYVIRAISGISLGNHLPATGNIGPFWPGISSLMTGHLPGSLGTIIGTVLPYAMAIAVLNAMESLLAAARLEDLSGIRSNANRVLIDQGIANIAGGAIGTLPIAPSVSRINIGWELGGRGQSALGIAAFTACLLILFGSRILPWVPVLVIGTLMLFLAWTMLDNWTHGQIRKILAASKLEPTLRRQVQTNIAVMLAVVLVAFSGHLIAAMAAGAMLAMFLFVRDFGRSVVGRSFLGSHRHSVVMRTADEAAWLERHGDSILVLELNGPIAFGSADRLLDHLHHLSARIRFLIFDFQHVREIDDKGARILVRLSKTLHSRSIDLHLSHIQSNGPRGSMLKDAGLSGLLPATNWHADTDHALECVENALLADRQIEEASKVLNLRGIEITNGLTDEELGILKNKLVAEEYPSGATVFVHGDTGDRLYIVGSGRIEIHLPLDNRRMLKRRIAAFLPGVVFGEMALLGGIKRSADAVATQQSLLWSLSAENMKSLQEQHPRLAVRLMFNLARQLSQRLAVTNDELRYATRS